MVSILSSLEHEFKEITNLKVNHLFRETFVNNQCLVSGLNH